MLSGSSGWVLTQYDWCPYKKGKFGHGHRHAHVKMEAEKGVTLPRATEHQRRPQMRQLGEAWGRFSLGPGRDQPGRHLGLGLLASGAVEESVSLCGFVTAAPANGQIS